MSRPRVLPGPLLRAMAGRRTNLALLWLLVGATLTGALNFALGTGWVAWPTVLHGVTGFAIVLLSGWKWAIARRGLDRRGPGSTWPSVLLGVLVVVAIVSGVLHSTGLVLEYGPVDDMQVHVGAGLAALPLSVWHLLARGGGAGRPEPARRELLRAALLLGSAGTLWVALEGVVAAAGLRGARRRATGSFEVASGAPERMPAIIWLFDPSPVLDPADWRAEIIVPGGRPDASA